MTAKNEQFGGKAAPGRFDRTDQDFGMRLEAQGSTPDEILRNVRSRAVVEAPCKHTTMGRVCGLPMGHGSPHQSLMHVTIDGDVRVASAVHWDDDGKPIDDYGRGVKCHGREATVLCDQPIYARRQATAYEDDASNFTMPVCDSCFETIQAEWSGEWAAYWRELIP